MPWQPTNLQFHSADFISQGGANPVFKLWRNDGLRDEACGYALICKARRNLWVIAAQHKPAMVQDIVKAG
ncbi:hypothetical protein GCM10010873_24250 [Cypionkella aquatica]|uniref:Uncharacterized protein n=1 Tax=Cypionkella aquatica TaxID=1756042 RepID=A0AA37U304_9RHOB|nr:hypothetical protein GCM10010873_24250 [Cypionkella aquatica]